MDERDTPDLDAALDDDIGDDLLRLIFTACHPVLSAEARVALTLRLIGGLTTEEIARAFLAAEPTIAQRIVRAKRTLTEAKVPFEVPRGAERAERLASVLEVIYLIFNEGYAATAGEDWMRPALCEEALRVGRILAELAPEEGEVHGLVALMEIQASRLKARTDAQGEPILLLEQNRARWDQLLIRRGLAALARAEAQGARAGLTCCRPRSRPVMRARAPPTRPTGGASPRSMSSLPAITPSPVVELNRAVAVAMAFGPQAGLERVDALAAEPTLKSYHLLPSVRGDFLKKLGRLEEARAEFERAAVADAERAREEAAAGARGPGDELAATFCPRRPKGDSADPPIVPRQAAHHVRQPQSEDTPCAACCLLPRSCSRPRRHLRFKLPYRRARSSAPDASDPLSRWRRSSGPAPLRARRRGSGARTERYSTTGMKSRPSLWSDRSAI